MLPSVPSPRLHWSSRPFTSEAPFRSNAYEAVSALTSHGDMLLVVTCMSCVYVCSPRGKLCAFLLYLAAAANEARLAPGLANEVYSIIVLLVSVTTFPSLIVTMVTI